MRIMKTNKEFFLIILNLIVESISFSSVVELVLVLLTVVVGNSVKSVSDSDVIDSVVDSVVIGSVVDSVIDSVVIDSVAIDSVVNSVVDVFEEKEVKGEEEKAEIILTSVVEDSIHSDHVNNGLFSSTGLADGVVGFLVVDVVLVVVGFLVVEVCFLIAGFLIIGFLVVETGFLLVETGFLVVDVVLVVVSFSLVDVVVLVVDVDVEILGASEDDSKNSDHVIICFLSTVGVDDDDDDDSFSSSDDF
jgi:hypothetical protein